MQTNEAARKVAQDEVNRNYQDQGWAFSLRDANARIAKARSLTPREQRGEWGGAYRSTIRWDRVERMYYWGWLR